MNDPGSFQAKRSAAGIVVAGFGKARSVRELWDPTEVGGCADQSTTGWKADSIVGETSGGGEVDERLARLDKAGKHPRTQGLSGGRIAKL